MKAALFKSPILVIDRDGFIGEPLCLKLSKEFSVVFVSKKSSASVPFFKKFPAIPDRKYSHIIFIDEDVRDLEFLSRIIDKVKDVNSEFIFAQGLSAKGEYAVGRILKAYPSAKVVLFGDIFDNELILRKESFNSVINKFIYQAQEFGKIQILGEGLRETYPVFLNDVVDGLIDIVFGMHKLHSLFYIFPNHPPTELSLAHMIQKINPEVRIDFIKHDPRSVKISYPANGWYLLDDKYLLAKKIRGIDIKKKVGIQEEVLHNNKKRLKSFPFFIQHRFGAGFMVWVFIFLLLVPLILTMLFSFLGLNTFYYAKAEIDKGNFINAKSSFHLSQAFFYAGKQTLNILSLQAKLIGRENNLQRLSQDLDLGYKMSQGILQAFNSGAYFSKILNGKSENPIGDFAKGENYIRSSIVALDRMKAEGKISAPILQNLEIVNPLIRLLSAAEDIMPSIFGMEGSRTYLILLQNNLELRPGGGVINFYGVLKLNMGKITEFSIYDINDADGQLRGHVEPPFALRRYLPEQHWYMKDSNFDVDFIKSALSSSNFLFIETGQKVSGIIAADTSFVKSILHAIGPVYMADYKETVNEENVSLGSAQKKDFLTSLYKTIMAKIAGDKTPYLLIAQAISDSLLQKHLMLVLNNDLQNIFTVNGWSSSLWDERKNEEKSVNDFLGISEADLGANEFNYFIKRQVSQKITIEKSGNISEELNINFKNESSASSGKDYKNYLRIILPLNTELSAISINDISQVLTAAITNPLIYEKAGFKPPQGLEIEKTNEENKIIYGLMVSVPAGEIVKVKINYNLAKKADVSLNVFSYNLKIFKQPGIESVPYSFSVSFPNSFKIIAGKASDSGKITEDKDLMINFAKK